MTLTNHILAGASIAVAVQWPAIALPLALASHFVLDAIPHFGYAGHRGYGEAIKHRLARIVGVADGVLAICIFVFLFSRSAWLAILCGFIAIMPDIFGVYYYVRYDNKGHTPPKVFSEFQNKFHRKIQWRERPWGLTIEILCALVLGAVIYSDLR